MIVLHAGKSEMVAAAALIAHYKRTNNILRRGISEGSDSTRSYSGGIEWGILVFWEQQDKVQNMKTVYVKMMMGVSVKAGTDVIKKEMDRFLK